ncbi:hypothetical protein JOL62DRAFT_620978 [Phyllosticta paracitricarpa]|uniref:Uncharacterized protein n=2 Tax=Phyllosticta TaxID=121621 RepID=A0ABR1M2U4_9PEZI
MTDEFGRWFKHYEKVPVEADTSTMRWYNRLTSTRGQQERLQIEADFMAEYHVTTAEAEAVRDYVEDFVLDPDAFNSLLRKLPSTEGLVQRVTQLDEATANMLIRGDPGLISRGERGIYEVRDPINGQPPRLIMTSSLVFQYDFDPAGGYRLIINSRTGKFVAPITAEAEQWDVLHLQGLSGRFKLLAYQPLNGGEAARLAKQPGPFGVFYLDEIPEAGPSTDAADAEARRAARLEVHRRSVPFYGNCRCTLGGKDFCEYAKVKKEFEQARIRFDIYSKMLERMDANGVFGERRHNLWTKVCEYEKAPKICRHSSRGWRRSRSRRRSRRG